MYLNLIKLSVLFKGILITVLIAFIGTIIGPLPIAQANDFCLPAPGVLIRLSPPLDPPILKGIKVHPDNPFRFDFILDKGDTYNRYPEQSGGSKQELLKTEATKLIKYFLASLTIPEKDLWVNLSPYEKDRIIPNSFGLTEMGRDLLAEDYMLKQITASLIYPEDQIGKNFWKRIYEEAAKRYGTTNIPVNTFNKVWIVPEKAVVYENAKAGTAYVVESKLKVMLEQDYLSLEKHEGIQSKQEKVKDSNQLGSQIVREIVIPQLTKEINENKNFAQLRQVYNSLILATWYKKKIKDSILEQVYADKNKEEGIMRKEEITDEMKDNKNIEIEGVYDLYFSNGTYDQVHFKNLQTQKRIFTLILDGLQDEGDMDLISNQRLKEKFPGLFKVSKHGKFVVEEPEEEFLELEGNGTLNGSGTEDEAMQSQKIPGGIDLTSANMNLQTQNIGGTITFHLDPAMLQQLQNAPGFVPVIINIQPLDSIRRFLGLNDSQSLKAG